MKSISKWMSGKAPQKTEEVPPNLPLLSKVQPHGNLKLSDERYIKTGNGFCSCIQIYGYPNQVGDFWLSPLINIDGVISTLDIGSADMQTASREISSSINELAQRYADAQKRDQQKDAEMHYQLLDQLLTSIKEDGEVIRRIFCRMYVPGRTREEVDEKVAAIIKDLESKDFSAAVMLNETQYQYAALFEPYDSQVKHPNKRVGNPVPAFSLAGGYPFNYEMLNDPYGMYIGHSETGGNIIFDLFCKTVSRTSYDALIVGKKGSGKSTLMKLLLLNNAIIGNYIRTVDVTGEFTDLAHELGGVVITLDGTEGIINCLEVFQTSEDESISYASHLSKLNTFYKFIAPSATEDVRNEFEEYARKLYAKKGLWDESKPESERKITGLPPDMYPTFTELLDLIREDLYEDFRSKKVNENLSPSKLERLESMELTINNLVKSYGKMFDGYTSIQSLGDQRVVVYNLQNIANMKDEIFNAMLFNVLSLMLEDMIQIGLPSKQKFESGVPIPELPKLILMIDEAHKIINTKNPQALDHMLHIVREGRKYFTALVFASQSIRDYAPESGNDLLEKLKTLFELTQCKFIMQQDPNALALMRNIFEGQFTESQLQMIPKFHQGETLLSTTDNTCHVFIEVSEQEIQLFKGGA